MDFARSSAGGRATASTKIVVAGGFGVGKTTLVGSVSEIKPLRTEALVTNESEGVDDLDAVPTKATTTVATKGDTTTAKTTMTKAPAKHKAKHHAKKKSHHKMASKKSTAKKPAAATPAKS